MEAFRLWLSDPFSLVSLGALLAALVWAALGALKEGASAYSKKKGENLATKEDLADAVRQLQEFESARTAIAHEDWIAREWKAVRVRNLETFQTALQESYEHAHNVLEYYTQGNVTDSYRGDGGLSVRLRMLQQLYYPELEGPLANFQQASLELRRLSGAFHSNQQRTRTPGAIERNTEIVSRLSGTMSDIDDALKECFSTLTELARNLFNLRPGVPGD